MLTRNLLKIKYNAKSLENIVRSVAGNTKGMYGVNPIPFTNKIEIYDKTKYPQIPVYRVIDHESAVVGNIETPKDLMVKLYKGMLEVRTMDDFLLRSQRQGTISFYMTALGEESIISTAAAVDKDDVIYSQYREAPVLYYRGYTFQEFVDQCSGLYTHETKGRQMPLHYSSIKLKWVTISSPLSTQIPQAAGYAFRQKLNKDKNITICYLGDGTSSEGDFHCGLNIASTLKCPVLYIVRNNGYAISTHISQQYMSDGIADKCIGYNIPSIRVDGNDTIAIYQATKLAREMVYKNQEPFLVELMSNRLGDHSTSDDSSAYRSKDDIKYLYKYEGVGRMRKYLENNKLWSEAQEKEVKERVFKELKECIDRALNAPPYPIDSLYEDVFSELSQHQKERTKLLMEHVNRNKEYYQDRH